MIGQFALSMIQNRWRTIIAVDTLLLQKHKNAAESRRREEDEDGFSDVVHISTVHTSMFTLFVWLSSRIC
jgi:hypothetical protein